MTAPTAIRNSWPSGASLPLVVVGLLLSQTASLAATKTSVTATVGNCCQAVIYPSDSQTDVDTSTTGSSTSYAEVLSFRTNPFYIGNRVAAKGTAYAALGVLKVAGDMAADQGGTARANLEARFSDAILISAPGLAGQKGTFSATMTFEWGAEVAFPGAAGSFTAASMRPTLVLNVAARGNTLQSRREESFSFYPESQYNTVQRSATDSNQTVPFSKTLRLDADITFGQAFSFEAILIGNVYGISNSGTSMGALWADRSAYWGGSSVTYQGHAVDFTMVSGTGHDWTQAVPVPEPATWALMLCSFPMFGALVRRRRA